MQAMIVRIFSEVGFKTGQPFQILNRVDNDNLHSFMQVFDYSHLFIFDDLQMLAGLCGICISICFFEF